MMTLKELLSRNPIFAHLGENERRDLAELAISRHYPKGSWITHYGDRWPYLFIIESGRVTALKESSEGRSLIVMTFERGEVFWGLAFFQDDIPMWVALVASQDCRLHLWSRESLLPILRQNGQMSWELACTLVRRMQRASDMVEELAFQPITGRLARMLLEHYGDAVGEAMAREMTLDEMAARIGTTREMVSRGLSSFAEQKAITISRTEFMITDQEMLEELARKGKG